MSYKLRIIERSSTERANTLVMRDAGDVLSRIPEIFAGYPTCTVVEVYVGPTLLFKVERDALVAAATEAVP